MLTGERIWSRKCFKFSKTGLFPIQDLRMIHSPGSTNFGSFSTSISQPLPMELESIPICTTKLIELDLAVESETCGILAKQTTLEPESSKIYTRVL
jgi:hypothetical protein